MQVIGNMYEKILKKKNSNINIVVATSGDTGGAVANGFLGVKGVNVVILYPSGKVSDIQEKQAHKHKLIHRM